MERDLALEVSRASATEALDHERDPEIEVWLVNRSASRSYPVVLANDGSEVGWREPHAFFTVERLGADGSWEALPRAEGARCGNYARDWEADVVTVAPGGRVKMPWMPFSRVELGDAAKVRITAHYAYGAIARDKAKVPPILHPMPEYALASTPLEIAVEHPYALTLRMKAPLPTAPEALLAPSLDVIVENRSGRTLPIGTSESGAQLWFELRGAGEPTPAPRHADLLFVDTVPTYPSKETLAPGARRSIVGAQTKTESAWERRAHPEGKPTQIRALWRIWDARVEGESGNVRRVESPWVDLP